MSLIQEYRSEYSSWYDMINRCTNPDVEYYRIYGGRGIKVCDRWIKSFQNFMTDMGPKHGDATTIERIDNDGDYTPENCCWATRTEQARNTRRNLYVTLNSETRSLAEWIEVLNLNKRTVHDRIYACGWTPEDALTKPIKEDPVYTYNCISLTLREWSERTGINHNTLRARVNSEKLSIKDAIETPVGKDKHAKTHMYQGEALTVRQLSEISGVSTGAIYSRIRRNWSIEKTVETPERGK